MDGRFLSFLAQELQSEVTTGRLQKVTQLGKTDFLFQIRVNNQNKKLYLSLSTSLSRVNLTQQTYPSDYLPGGFCMFLRKHLEGGFIDSIQTLSEDRIMEISLDATNDIGDRVKLYLIFEMFSRYTNLILLDENRQILNAFKHVSPFDASDRTIANGIVYEVPQDNKISPNDLNAIQLFLKEERTYKDLVEHIKGISPLFANYVLRTAHHNPSMTYQSYVEAINLPLKPTIILGDKTEFYHLDIFSKNQKYFDTLSELIDFYFTEASALERVKQIHKYLNGFVKREYKRKKNKLEKLTIELKQALENDIWRIKGDTLITYQNQIQRGDSSYKGFSYELDSEIEIELDRLLNPIQNANKYYTKYKKQKTAVAHIENQISITKQEIAYFRELLDQIEETQSLNDLNEIQEELIENGYLSKKKSNKSKQKPNYDSYTDELGIRILVGKNNLQNNFLTHKYAHKSHWWFHVKNQTGSHVIVWSDEELTEPTIRMAAMLAARNSKSRHSSSVPVDYTRIRNIKKVPGTLGSFVTYTNQKTIYIDPEE
ncbi:MAG: NFACT family protein [Bacilli bacterium]|nr:NFACT family protein [Bacilli bacterium]